MSSTDHAHPRYGWTGTTPRGSALVPGRAARLSLLWVFAMLNYLYCDVLGLYDVEVLKDVLNGTGVVDMTQGFLFGSAVMMEIPMAMVLLSVVLPRAGSRWANVAAGLVMTVIQLGSLFVGTPTAYYAFFSAVEVATTLAVVLYAWTWRAAPDEDGHG